MRNFVFWPFELLLKLQIAHEILSLYIFGTSLAGPWLRLHPSNIGGTGSITGWEIRIPHAVQCGKKKKKKKIYTHTHTYMFEILTDLSIILFCNRK